MSHRLMDEIAGLKVQLRDTAAEIKAAMAGPIVDLAAVAAIQRRRQEIWAWLEQAEQAASR